MKIWVRIEDRVIGYVEHERRDGSPARGNYGIVGIVGFLADESSVEPVDILPYRRVVVRRAFHPMSHCHASDTDALDCASGNVDTQEIGLW